MDGFPLTTFLRSRRIAAQAAASAAAAAFLPAAALASITPAALTNSQNAAFEQALIRARFTIVEEGDKESILQRLQVLDDGIGTLGGGFADLAATAQSLRERADRARVRGARDGYFAFDVSAFHDAVWERRAEAVLDLEEIGQLLSVSRRDKDISRRAAKAAKTAQTAAARALELGTALRSMSDSAAQGGDDLLGDNAEGLAALASQDAADLCKQARLIQAALAILTQRTSP